MSEPGAIPPSLQPRDEDEERADRALLGQLCATTAQVVQPLLLERLARLDEQGLAASIRRQARAMRDFLIDDRKAGGRADSAGRAALHRELEPFVQPSPPESPAAVRNQALARQLALEFAGSMWATVVSRLNRACGADRLVAPQQLLPANLVTDSTALLEQIAADACHFRLSPQQIKLVMADTLSALLKTEHADPDYLHWPLGLRIDRHALNLQLRLARASLPLDVDALLVSSPQPDYGQVPHWLR